MFRRSEGVDDLCLISSMSNDEITNQLKARLAQEKIYTSIGDVLISVNPFKRLPIYGPEFIQLYSSQTAFDVTPHVYQLAQTAYSSMMQESNPQSIVISGESGAGKTEAAKLILNFISAVSGSSPTAQSVKANIESTNPILESFGNAKTVRNDNSSRFGKYLEISFNDEGEPAGGQTFKFLLERSRVASQGKNERNFHVFYQLLRGATAEMRESFGLMDVKDFYYLNQTGCYDVPGVDDAADFQDVLQAMGVLGIPWEEQWKCFQVLAAILHIGNISFEGDPRAVVTNAVELQWASYLLGIDQEKLSYMLTTRLIMSPRGSSYASPQNAVQCCAMRDALAKTLYDRIFNWLVEKINAAMVPVGLGANVYGNGNKNFHQKNGGGAGVAFGRSGFGSEAPNRGGFGGPPPPAGRPGGGAPPPLPPGGRNGPKPPAPAPGRGGPQGGGLASRANFFENDKKQSNFAPAPSSGASKPHCKSIGVLDIYGFEIFKQNGFEQFCINYVNERLQQTFIDLTLKKEQAEYHSEGLQWRDIPFFDNIIVLELIEGKNPPGIFRVLDDVCRSLHATEGDAADAQFMDRVAKAFTGHPHLALAHNSAFTIKHYAGDVTYSCREFTMKNKDSLFQSIVMGMQSTQEPWIAGLFSQELQANSKSGPPPTAGMDIRQSCQALMERLNVCAGHYVRTVKPNETRSALTFVTDNVKHQVQYLGLLENVKVKKAGYSYRHYYANFLQRFGPVYEQWNEFGKPPQNPQTNPNIPSLWSMDERKAVDTLLNKFCSLPPLNEMSPVIDRDEFAFGKTKIFVKSPETLFTMSEWLERVLDPAGYQQKLEEAKQVEKLAGKHKRGQNRDKGIGGKCSVM